MFKVVPFYLHQLSFCSIKIELKIYTKIKSMTPSLNRREREREFSHFISHIQRRHQPRKVNKMSKNCTAVADGGNVEKKKIHVGREVLYIKVLTRFTQNTKNVDLSVVVIILLHVLMGFMRIITNL